MIQTIWVFPKIMVPQNGLFISWKTLWTNGWFGGVKNPIFGLTPIWPMLIIFFKPVCKKCSNVGSFPKEWDAMLEIFGLDREGRPTNGDRWLGGLVSKRRIFPTTQKNLFVWRVVWLKRYKKSSKLKFCGFFSNFFLRLRLDLDVRMFWMNPPCRCFTDLRVCVFYGYAGKNSAPPNMVDKF